MKKLLTFALAALAVQMQAATINWGLGADVYLMKAGEDYTSAVLGDNAAAPEVASGSYLALVYLGNQVNSFDIGDITEDSEVATAPWQGVDTEFGGVDYKPFLTETQVTDTTKYADNSSFAVVWFDGGRGKYDYIYSIDDGSAFNQGATISDMTRGSKDILPASETQGYGGVLAVPEPSVAILGLLGLSMLLKRRKA